MIVRTNLDRLLEEVKSQPFKATVYVKDEYSRALINQALMAKIIKIQLEALKRIKRYPLQDAGTTAARAIYQAEEIAKGENGL